MQISYKIDKIDEYQSSSTNDIMKLTNAKALLCFQAFA